MPWNHTVSQQRLPQLFCQGEKIVDSICKSGNETWMEEQTEDDDQNEMD